MTPELIKQFRLELRRNGISLKTDVAAYAKSIGIDTARRTADSTSTGSETLPAAVPVAAPTEPSAAVKKAQQHLIDYVSHRLIKYKIPGDHSKWIDKIKSVNDRSQLEQLALDFSNLEKALAAHSDPTKQQAAAGVAAAAAAAAAKKNASSQESQPRQQNSSKLTDEINSALMQNRARFMEVVAPFRTQGFNPAKDGSLTPSPDVSKSIFVAVQANDGRALLYPGFEFRATLGFWTSDNKRPYEDRIEPYFEDVEGYFEIIYPAVIESLDNPRVVSKGKLKVPFA